jgi:predicted transcriptional regulator
LVITAKAGRKQGNNVADDKPELNTIALATELTVAWLSNPNVRATADDVPTFLRNIHGTLSELGQGAQVSEPEAPAEPTYEPAVSARASIRPDYLVSMIDGKRYKTLRRHLSTHGLTPEEYRRRYGLKPDYPMVAPSYSAMRREAAERIGLGRKRQGDAAAAADGAAPESAAADEAPAQTADAPAADTKPAGRGRKAAAADAAPAKPRQGRKSKVETAESGLAPDSAPKARRARTAPAAAESTGLVAAKAPRRKLSIAVPKG